MPKVKHVEMEGRVIDCGRGGHFRVLCDTERGEHVVIAKLSGKMRQNRIRIVLGDEVKVLVSPYDPTRGILVFRSR